MNFIFKFTATVDIHTGKVDIHMRQVEAGEAWAALIHADMVVEGAYALAQGGTLISTYATPGENSTKIQFNGYTFAANEQDAMNMTRQRWEETKEYLINAIAIQN